MNENRMLQVGAALSFAVALLHVAIIFIGAPAYRFFGAGEEMAASAEAGSLLPALLTSALVVIFALWGLYALSGAGVIRPLPLLLTALVLIGAIYTLRGLAIFQQVFQVLTSSKVIEAREAIFSLVSLGIGLVYLAGTFADWKQLRARSRSS